MACETRAMVSPSTVHTSPETWPGVKVSSNHHGSTTITPPSSRCASNRRSVATSSGSVMAWPMEPNMQVTTE
ncbi:hypothetical protein SF12_02950 [Streptomyces sp. MBRL 601]|nr:hypothetical protein SF12_02950 [Streptomyces sp. MBRL 601]